MNSTSNHTSSILENDCKGKETYYLEADLLPRPGVPFGRVRVRIKLPKDSNYWMIDWGLDSYDSSAGLWLVDSDHAAYYHLAGRAAETYQHVYEKDKYITSRFLQFHKVLIHEGMYD